MKIEPPPALPSSDAQLGEKCVAMLVSGGLEHAGGIGRWAGYLQDSWLRQNLQPRLDIVDTRGHGRLLVAAITFIGALGHLARLRWQGRLGAIHANLSVRGSTARKCIVGLFARVIGVPIVLHLHGAGYCEFYDALPRWGQHSVRHLFKRSQHVIVLGEEWARWVVSALGVPHSKVTILYNGVQRPSREIRRAPDTNASCHIVLLGRLGQRKGVPELIEALASDTLRHRPWRATLAGDGDVDVFRRMVASKGLADRVALPGWLDQVTATALLAGSDILVLPSHAENFPISIIEALSYQVAVVATPVGATPELLTDEQSALFIPVGDVGALAQALAKLIDDPALRRKIADAGHRVFLDKLDIDMLARNLAALHGQTIAATW